MLSDLENQINDLIAQYFNSGFSIKIKYKKELPKEYEQELRAKRSLFGAHLDNYIIQFQDKKSKSFASRGQQKLIVLLIKIALVQTLHSPIFLLDDFLVDFDDENDIFIEPRVISQCPHSRLARADTPQRMPERRVDHAMH